MLPDWLYATCVPRTLNARQGVHLHIVFRAYPELCPTSKTEAFSENS